MTVRLGYLGSSPALVGRVLYSDITPEDFACRQYISVTGCPRGAALYSGKDWILNVNHLVWIDDDHS